MGAVKFVAGTPKRVIGRVRVLVDKTLADGPVGTVDAIRDGVKGGFHEVKNAVNTLGNDVVR